MRKKLIVAVVALGVVLAMAVALLIYLELTQEGAPPADTKPTSSADSNTEPTETSGQAEATQPTSGMAEESEVPGSSETMGDVPVEPETTETEPGVIAETEQTASTTEPIENSNGEVIIGPDNSKPDDTQPAQEPDSTEYTPPEGLDEDETPIL